MIADFKTFAKQAFVKLISSYLPIYFEKKYSQPCPNYVNVQTSINQILYS